MPIISNFPTGGGSGGGTGLTLAACTGITTVVAHEKVYVKWTDPDDIVVSGSTLASWGGTILVRKAGSAPVSRRDGTVVLDSKTRNAYQDTYFCDSGLTDGQTYYYKLFPYTTTNAFTDSDDDLFSAVPNAVAPGNVSGMSTAAAGNGKLAISWTDPDATIVTDGITVSTWASTKVVVKAGSYATDPDDADAAFSFNSTTRNAYSSTPLTATGLTNGTTYYVSIFPISTDGAVNVNTANRITGTPDRFIIAALPTQSGTLTFTEGTPQTPTWSGEDASKMTKTETAQTNAGTYQTTFTPTEDYKWWDGSTVGKYADWTIGKTDPVVTAPSAKTLTYNGGEQTLINAGSTTGGTLRYSLDGTTYSTDLPTGTDQGSYTVYYNVLGGQNYNDVAAASITVTISKKTLTITAKAQTITYGGSIATGTDQVTVSGLASGDALDSITLTPSTANVTTNGTITPSAAVIKDGSTVVTGNYTIGYNTGNLTINKAASSVTKAPTGKTGLVYTGDAQALIEAGTASGGEIQYSLDGTTYSASIPTGTNANVSGYTVYYKVVGDSNHNDTAAQTLTVSIAKADFTATVSISNYTYAGTKSTPSISNNPGNGTVTYYGRASASGTATEWSQVTNTTYNAGTRYCYAVIAETTNYNSYTTPNKSFTIGKATPSAPTLSKTSMTLNSSKTSDTFTVSRTGDGKINVASSDTGVATVTPASATGSNPQTFTVNSVNSTTGTATVTVTVEEGTNYLAYSGTGAQVAVTAQFVSIYGVTWDGTSTTALSRTDASANFTDPVPALSNGTGSSPFDNLAPWKDMTRVTDSAAGEMVKIPKFWYKISTNPLKIQIADGALSGYSVCPACMDRGDGKGERDYILVGRYHCSSSNYKSATGVTPKASITRSTARSSIAALGTGISQMDFTTRFTIWLLYIVEFADWNSQTKIGYGCGNNSSTQNMGYTDSMQYHTGTTQSSRTTYGLGTQYRYIEGLWDNVYDWLDGCYYNSNGLNIILNPANFSDTANGTLVGKPTGGYPTVLTVSSAAGFPMFYPTTAGGSNTTYIPDYWYFYTSGPCLYCGGYYGQDVDYGLFCISYYGASGTSGVIGCRLQKLP